MSSVTDHYSSLLAPIYLWMAGGLDAAIVQGTAEVSPYVPADAHGRTAVDLGAGFGMHAIPLARAGYSVTAIDTSAQLLDTLRTHAAGLGITTIQADLLEFRAHLVRPASLILCMGDTLTHVQETTAVSRLLEDVASALAPGGRFVATFRDYTRPAGGNARFIPVRSDTDRIHTCFLEEEAGHMLVHDIVHERDGSAWTMRVSSYRKLRLSPRWVADALECAHLDTTIDDGPRGMVRVTAIRSA